MSNRKSMTATVYVTNNDKVLLHTHKKYNSLFPVGGHLEEGELPFNNTYETIRCKRTDIFSFFISKGK